MNIQTKYHGKTEIHTENIITFADGIPSFEDEKKFILLELGEDSAYFVLQSTNTPAVAFLVTSPFAFFPDYQIELSDSAIVKLHVENKEDVAVFGILTVKEPFDQTTINLKGPVIINSKQKLGKQIVLNEADYHTRHGLFQKKSSVGEGR